MGVCLGLCERHHSQGVVESAVLHCLLSDRGPATAEQFPSKSCIIHSYVHIYVYICVQNHCPYNLASGRRLLSRPFQERLRCAGALPGKAPAPRAKVVFVPSIRASEASQPLLAAARPDVPKSSTRTSKVPKGMVHIPVTLGVKAISFGTSEVQVGGTSLPVLLQNRPGVAGRITCRTARALDNRA